MNSAHLRTKVRDSTQFGGVSVWSINAAAHRVMKSGADDMGRWAWTRYRGRGGVTIRVVAGYRPVENKTGPMSVWNQQKTALLN
jgi:CubicO group peptidase (beta-lactamase class C family)